MFERKRNAYKTLVRNSEKERAVGTTGLIYVWII
jgi:hypothetical protein